MSDRASLDPILEERLRALDRDLGRTIDVCDAKTRDLEFQQYPVDADAWNRAFKTVRASAHTAQQRIEDLRTDFAEEGEDARGAWRRHQLLTAETRDVCRACMELLGGFALRDHMPADKSDRFLDQKICHFTEKIAELCNELTTPDLNPLLAIPAAEDPLAETMARIIRLRFPEWTIWTLPLVAYEYARVVFDDIEQLQAAIDDEVRRRMEDDEPPSQKDVALAVTTQLADVFGTYVMGPAYACAAVMLRLEPIASDGVEKGDLERVATLFATVQRLYGDEDPAVFVKENLRRPWELALEGVESTADEKRIKQAERFAARALRIVERTTYADAKFESYAETGEHWARAKKLSESWCIEQGGKGADPNAPKRFRLREVLNAAWRSRLMMPGSREDFAGLAREASDTVFQREAAGPGEIPRPKGAQPQAVR